MPGELVHRVATAAVLVPLLLAAVVYLSTPALAAVLALPVITGAAEWARLAGWTRPLSGPALLAAIGLALVAVALNLASRPLLMLLASLACLWWLVAFGLILRFEAGRDTGFGGPAAAGVALVVLVPAWSSVLALHQIPEAGYRYVIALLLLVWAADIGAYVAGRRWGRRKLAPRVSPGKTWEGCIGALLAAALLAGAAGIASGAGLLRTSAIAALALATVIFSIVGDLFESLMKRRSNLKDSGSVLPGHGGVLDRIDSITAAAPVFLLGLHVLGEP